MKKLLTLGALSLAAALSQNANADLLGQDLSAGYYFPNLGHKYGGASFSPSTFTVGAGVETVGNVEGVTSLITDFDASSLTITFRTQLDNPTWSNASFNGVMFKDLSGTGLKLASATVDGSTTMGGFDNSHVSFTSGALMLDWHGLNYHNGEQVKLNFEFVGQPVPEAATFQFAGVGALIAWSVMMLRRRQG
jgi:hypothetical protein